MNLWNWLNQNAGALQSIAAISVVVLTAASIVVLGVTWKAIKRGSIASEAQAEAARALTQLAKEQTEVTRQQTAAIAKQSEAALLSADATKAANTIAEESNRLSAEQMRADLLPILILDTERLPPDTIRETIRNVGRGAAKDVQISMGTSKDDMPKTYIASRTLIGSGDEVMISIDQVLFHQAGMTVHYLSLDGRRFVTSIYRRYDATKHQFEELIS